MQLVQPYTLFTGTSADWLAAGAGMVLLLSAVSYLRLIGGAKRDEYRPDLAWLRALLYFSLGLILSWSLGVLQSLLSMPLLTQSQLSDPWWLAYTGLYCAVLWVGYAVLWPRGTFSDGRKRHPVIGTIYGTLWGLCHGQVFLCIWALVEHGGLALVEQGGLNSYWVAGITYAVLSGYNFAFHQFFWDIYVSPPHNYVAWNMKKVQYCHVPNLLLGLTWLAIWGNFSLWLLMQTFALLASVHSMRFPAWYDDYRGVAGATR
jgi:hypothetical protein